MTNMPKPRIPAAMKKLGATELKRTVGSIFNLSFELIGDDSKAEGNGPALCSAAARKWPEAEISWPGTQSHAISLDFTRHWKGEPMPPAAKGKAKPNEPEVKREASADEHAAEGHLDAAETAMRKAIKALIAAGHTNSVEALRAIRRQVQDIQPLKGDGAAA